MRKLFWIVLVVTLALTNLAFAEEDFIPEEWVTLEEARTMYAEAIGEDTFEMTVRSSYWWEDTTNGWYQFESAYGSTTVAMNVRGEHVRITPEVIAELEAHGAYLNEEGRFTIESDVFPWNAYLVVDSTWGEILLDKWIVDQFINHCVEGKEASQWISLEEAIELFEEALGVDTFKVTCQHAFWISGSTDAWLQIHAGYENVGSASTLKIADILFPVEKLEEYGVSWNDSTHKFTIDPNNPHIHSFEGIEITSEWGDVYLSRERVEEFLDYCINAWSEDVTTEE